MGQTESNLGIIPGYGGTQRLPRLIGRTKALEFLILGSLIPAQECLALGLVNRLSKEGETLNDAKALARQLAKRAPIATRLIRSAAEFADTLEADAQRASEAQLSKTEEEVRRRRREQQDREAEIERFRQESERQRAEVLNNTRNEAREG